MQKTRMVLSFIAAFYLLASLLASGQYLDKKVAILEERLNSHIHDVTEPIQSRLNALEDHIRIRDIAMEGRLSRLEQAVATYGQLLMAVGTGVLIQLISSGIGVLRAIRLNAGSKT